jgi:putative Flp pilus-assembly TadE/G-like protein
MNFSLRTEEGGILVLVGLLMPALVLLIAVVVEIGNWYVHKRHLQIQVDAAALAAGQEFAGCLRSSGGTVESNMESVALDYGGRRWNAQVGSPGSAGAVTLWFQRNAFPPPASPPAPETDVAEGQDACTSAMFDVKATEAGIPHLFNIPLLPTNVHAHARVQLRQLTELKGLLPVAVPDVRFNYAFATFIDESTGNPPSGCPGTCTIQLQKSGVSGGEQYWATPAALNVPITSAHIGVRLRLVAGPNPGAACDTLYTECYDALSSNGVVHIRGWSAGSGVSLQNAWLLGGSCVPDAYFAKADCPSGAGVQAEVDLGDHPVSGTGITANVWATVDGGGAKYQLTKGAGTTGLITWTLLSGLPLAGPGAHQVSLSWDWAQTSGTWHGFTCSTSGGNKCKDNGTFGYVQRGYVASLDGSGPVHLVKVGESGISTGGANSFRIGTSHSLEVTITTTGNLAVQSQATDPVIYLRVTGSRNQSIDCDPDISNLRDEIAKGCDKTYEINQTFDCPAYNELWGTPQPWDCVKTQTGGAVGQVEKGMQDRILGGSNSCTAPVNWPNYGVDDRRIVPLLITPFGSFSGSGNTVMPVIDFGAFYVMGWNGDPCPGAVSVPKGYIAGHFIKYIPRNPNGSGDTACFLTDPTQLTPCAAVMTR